jgi:hypothetical protein
MCFYSAFFFFSSYHSSGLDISSLVNITWTTFDPFYLLLWSRWPRRLIHEIFSLVQTLGSWVWILLEAWLFVRVSSVFVLSCVGSGLATGLITRPTVLPTVRRIHRSRLMLIGNRFQSLYERYMKNPLCCSSPNLRSGECLHLRNLNFIHITRKY